MLGETFYNDRLSTTSPLLCQCSGDCREQKTELPSLVLNQLFMNCYPWWHNLLPMMAINEFYMLPGIYRKRRDLSSVSWRLVIIVSIGGLTGRNSTLNLEPYL